MTSIAQAQPYDVGRLALLMQELAERSGDAAQRADRARSVCWSGVAAEAYKQGLTEAAARLRAAQEAHAAAGMALLRYAGQLEDAVATAHNAQTLQQQADRQRAAETWPTGPYPSDVPRLQAARLDDEARTYEATSAARAAATLREQAARAPAAARGTGTMRFLGDLADAGNAAIVGPFELAALGVRALPGIGDGQDRAALGSALKDSVKVWEPFQDAWADLRGGRPGRGTGTLLGIAAARGRGRLPQVADPARIKQHGYLAGVREGQLTVDDAEVAWELAHREQLRRVAPRPPLPPVSDVLAGHASLVAQEAHGGHTLDRHVGKSVAFLRLRQSLEGGSKSSFPNPNVAESAVAQALRQRHGDIVAFLAGRDESAIIAAPLPHPLGTVVNRRGEVRAGSVVVIRLIRQEDGLLIHSAWLS